MRLDLRSLGVQAADLGFQFELHANDELHVKIITGAVLVFKNFDDDAAMGFLGVPSYDHPPLGFMTGSNQYVETWSWLVELMGLERTTRCVPCGL
ncbi:MAG: hypothetical protein GY925_15265 [Actinomycetia bacterium]|nr:hypothetical protein [Actinomycetes bacterium]